MSEQEKYGKDWVRLDMMVNQKTGEYHILKGDRVPGCGDMPYIGMEVLKRHLASQSSEREVPRCSECHLPDPHHLEGCSHRTNQPNERGCECM